MGFPVGGTGVGGSPVPPQIFESQTNAFNEAMKNAMAMLPYGSSIIIPWTQQGTEEVFQYRSEPGRPMLHPLLFLRASAEMAVIEEGMFQPLYEELLQLLPQDMREWLVFEMRQPFSERDPDAVALHHTLSATASTIGWLSIVNQPIEANSPAATYLLLNIALPFVALKGALGQAAFVMQQAQNLINQAGPNYPHFDTFNHSLSDIQQSIVEALALQREVEKGLVTEDVKRRLIECANLLHEIADSFNAGAASNDLSIIGAQLDSLATVLSAWAVSRGTPALILGSSIALIGLNNHTSVLGPFGFGFDTVMDAAIDGILNSFLFGPRAEIDELTGLYNELAALRNGI
jgi:hypothetical protein